MRNKGQLNSSYLGFMKCLDPKKDLPSFCLLSRSYKDMLTSLLHGICTILSKYLV